MSSKVVAKLISGAVLFLFAPQATAQSSREGPVWHNARTRDDGVTCMVWDEAPNEGATPWWLGKCANGKAAGDGALVWVLAGSTIQVMRGAFSDGRPDGSISVQSRGSADFTSDFTFQNGLPIAKTVKYISGAQLSGPVDRFGRFNGTVNRSLSYLGAQYKEWYSGGVRVYSEFDNALNLAKIERLEIIDTYLVVAYNSGSAFGEIRLSYYCPKLKKGKPFKLVAYKDEIRPSDTIVVNGKACGYANFKLYS